MKGGYTYSNKTHYGSYQYMHIGPEEWTYDIEKNTWKSSGEGKTFPSDTRIYRKKPYIPEQYTDGDRPDRTTTEKHLAELPENTWVDMKVPKKYKAGM